MIRFKYVLGHEKEVKQFMNNPLAYLIQWCYKEANKAQRRRGKGEIMTELEQKGFYLMRKDSMQYNRSIPETI